MAVKDASRVRFHNLRAMGRSPLHCLQSFQADTKPTAAMDIGKAIHGVLFDTENVAAYPGPVRRGKAYDAFVEEHPTASMILTLTDYGRVMSAVDAIVKNKIAMDVLRGAREETLLFDFLGLDCRVTPDVRAAEHVTELKSTSNAEPFKFAGHATRMGYHAQLAWQQIGVAESNLGQPKTAYVVAVEQSAPFAVTVLRLTDRALDAGHRLCRLWAERIKVCMDSGSWPAYSDAIVDLDVPDDFNLTFEDENGNEVTESPDVPF